MTSQRIAGGLPNLLFNILFVAFLAIAMLLIPWLMGLWL